MLQEKNQYGKCSRCGDDLVVGERTTVEEEVLTPYGYQKTGRVISMVGYLVCPSCLKRVCVDDTFDRVIKRY